MMGKDFNPEVDQRSLQGEILLSRAENVRNKVDF
jgi:hypothetical protein